MATVNGNEKKNLTIKEVKNYMAMKNNECNFLKAKLKETSDELALLKKENNTKTESS